MRIEALDLDGLGVAGADRVPFSLPGEVWDPARGLVEAVADRVEPGCPQFGRCGGCGLQHASDRFVALWKRGVIERALAGQGIETPVESTLTSPPRSRRRAVLAGRRMKKSVVVGFHGWRSETLVGLDGCDVLRPAIVAARPALAALVRVGGTRSAELRLTVTDGPAGLDVDCTGGREADASLRMALAEIAEAADFARLSWSGELLALRRPPVQRMGRALVVPPAGGFLQATAEGEAALVAGVCAAVGSAGRVADLFCGCGTFALPLAERAEVLAIEGEAAAVAALDAGWRATVGLKRVVARARDLFRRPLMTSEFKGLEAVILDPPRAGAEAQCRELARAEVARVAMVSCNPVTFARDARLLIEGGFRLGRVQPVDQFRWSAHVELVAAFSR